MAATASVGTSFSPSLHTLQCTLIRQYPSGSLLRISAPFRIRVAPLSRSCCVEPVSVVSPPCRLMHRVCAVVAHEETAVAESVAEEEVAGVEGEVEGGDAVTTQLYFGNLPYGIDSAQLAGLLQDYGSPELVEVFYNKHTGRSKGFGFVTMSSLEDCNAVIENLDGRECMGRMLRVNFSDKPRPKEPLYPETEHKLFVKNLAWSVTSESLAKKFQEYGNVVGARVLYNGVTGRSRGCGFVCYSERSELEAALENLNGVELEGRTMRVSLAQGKKSQDEL